MNPSIGEEGGQTARTLIQSLSSTPVILALVVFNVLYIASGVYVQLKQSERFADNQKLWEHMVEQALALCGERQKPGP